VPIVLSGLNTSIWSNLIAGLRRVAFGPVSAQLIVLFPCVSDADAFCIDPRPPLNPQPPLSSASQRLT
jgi:hypothetical protein